MADKFSNIKERIIELAKNEGFTMEIFFQKIGMSYGNFKGKSKLTPINSDAIANISTIIPNVNFEWLITGNGPMIKENAPSALPDQDYNKLKEEIAILRKEIESLLKDKVDLLNRIVNLQDESHNKSHQHTNIRTKPGKLKSN